MPCHNRWDTASKSVEALWKHSTGNVHLIVVDDCSVPGSCEKLLPSWPGEITVVRTSKELFWARSLAVGEVEARKTNPDFIIWLNEDTQLADNIAGLLHPDFIGVAKVITPSGDDIKGPLTQIAPCKFRLWKPGQSIDTFHGYCVSIPRSAYIRLQIEDYSHAFADLHYGLDARNLNIPIVASNVRATTATQQRINWRDLKTASARFSACIAPTGLPFGDWWKFCRNFGGPLFVARFLSPYRFFLYRRLSKAKNDIAE